MHNWWSLGEGSGYQGSGLEYHQITCPFCVERGNFALANHAEKKKPNGSKILNFDTLRCGNCSGYVMVLWSMAESGRNLSGRGLYDFRVLPWPARLDRAPAHWPAAVGRYWLQAHRSLQDENWDAAAVMARSAMQIALRDYGAEGRSLFEQINHLGSQGILPPHMKAWAHELRELGNEAAHPDPALAAAARDDVQDMIEFVDFLFEYLYTLPHRIAQYRERRGAS